LLGAIRDFKNIMVAQGYWNEARWNEGKHIYTFEGKTILEFISFDKFGKAHGPRRDVLFLNEANNLPYDIADQLITRTRKIVWLDWNPSEEFWFYTDIHGKRDDVDFITLTYLDNEAIDLITKNEIEAHKFNKRWWQVYGLGQLGEIEGKIYTDWQLIDDIPHEAKLERRGLDFGYSVDPTVIEDIYSYNGGFILDELCYQKGLSNKSIADILSANERQNILTIADSAEPKSIEEIKNYGVNIVGALKGPGSVNKGIAFVQAQRISLTNRSVKTIKGYRNYIFKNVNGKFVNEPDDTVHEWSNPMDAVRYGLESFQPRPTNQLGANQRKSFI
jgi:phage terminase large subunit